MDGPAPPAYQTDTPPSETLLPSNSNVHINSPSNISGIRGQIHDNCITLFHLANGEKGRKNMPSAFRIITYKSPTPVPDHPANQTRATIMQDWSSSAMILPFVQGPAAETTEAALLALLEKVELMIGRRWAGIPKMSAPSARWSNYMEK